MSRPTGCVLLVVFGLAAVVVVGAVLTGIVKARAAQGRVYCENNLRQLGLFAAIPPAPKPDAPVDPAPRTAVPPGTVVNLALSPDRRLSWAADALPVFDRRQQDPALAGRIDRTAAWDAGPNAEVAATRIGTLTCPGNPAAAGMTQYLGASGLDPRGADLGLDPPDRARAGCFRYDAPTPYAAITDGLSNTVLFAETNRDLGPWLRGGPSTVRGLLEGETAPPPVGVGGQFGGNHVGGANVGMADGSGRFVSDRVTPAFLAGLMMIAGGPEELRVGS